MGKNYKKVCRISKYTEHFLILTSAISGCVSISAFAFLVSIPIGTRSSAIELKICAITEAIKKHKSIIKNNKEKHNKVVLLAKTIKSCIT